MQHFLSFLPFKSENLIVLSLVNVFERCVSFMPQKIKCKSIKNRLKNIAKYSHLDSAVGTNNNSEINEQAPTKVGVIA